MKIYLEILMRVSILSTCWYLIYFSMVALTLKEFQISSHLGDKLFSKWEPAIYLKWY